jgi:myosin heavy subunit
LEDMKNYRYLTYGNVPVAGQDDSELYRQLLEAMDIMAFSKDEQDCKDCNYCISVTHNCLVQLQTTN